MVRPSGYRGLPIWLALGVVPVSPAQAITETYFQVDLTRHITHDLRQPLLNMAGADLSNLISCARSDEIPRTTLKGIPFRLDGVVLVGPGQTWGSRTGGPVKMARQVAGIPIGRRADRLYFLHAACFWGKPGSRIGVYRIHYQNRSTEEIPIRYGEDLRDWWLIPGLPNVLPQSEVVWKGYNEASLRFNPGTFIQLYLRTWHNPHPDQKIASLDMVTGDQKAGEYAPVPFLVAVTAALDHAGAVGSK
jgi:hypothetical protein